MELNKIIQGDCLEVIKNIENDSIDLIITDPPYGDGIGYGRSHKTIENNEDESINYKIIPDLYRVLKSGGFCIYLLIGSFLLKYKNLLHVKHNLL